ncbi:SAM-dependent methyltransferase, partial [Gemmata sp. JC673]
MKRPAQHTLFDFLTDTEITSEKLASLAVALGARTVAGWSDAEQRLTRLLVPVEDWLVEESIQKIKAGEDPLGEYFCRLRSAEERRDQGATYTPFRIADWMIERAAERYGPPARVVDPGVGSARFLGRAGKIFPKALLVGVEIDPLPALLARASLATLGLGNRSQIVLADYRDAPLGRVDGRTLYIGNPPYLRHHQITPAWKRWLTEESRKLGLDASQLAGLHVHFFLSTAQRASPGDVGVFITAAEWLDVNYGKLVRDLFLGPLGGQRIDVIEPTAEPFPDAASTAAITFFETGAQPEQVILRRVATIDGLGDVSKERVVRRERLEAESRWTHLTRAGQKGPKGYVELGELCRVHRGQVTGANKFWIAGEHSRDLPANVFYPTVTKARELIRAGKVLEDAAVLRRVIDLPSDLDVFDAEERKAVNRFLTNAKKLQVHEGYVAANRRAWWSVRLREPAPILATYMARRPPAFVRNRADARHINIAHGLYPREDFGESVLSNLVDYLSTSVRVAEGRTYAGGLTKF